MAEATDRSPAPGQPPADAVTSGETFGAPAPAVTETYRPLSLLAMAGFGIAVLYTLIVVGGGAVSLFSRIPWLMAYWTFLIPLAALIVCSAARARIQNSEGTLSGRAFTTWGTRLAIVVGLSYAAYYSVTFLVVRHEAIACADHFFETLKQGQLEQAFLMSKGIPTKGLTPDEMRTEVEFRFNQPRSRRSPAGEFTRFREDQFVRFVTMDGEKTNFSPRGVLGWEYVPGGYKVVLNYHVETTMTAFDVKLETFGRDPQAGESKRRQWQVNFASNFSILADSQTLTPAGQDFGQKTIMAKSFATEWLAKANQGQWKEAYLETLDPSERERLRKDPKLLPAEPGSVLSKLVHIDPKFWAGAEKLREEMKQRIGRTFKLGIVGFPTFSMNLQEQAMPVLREEMQESDKRPKEIFDVVIYYLDETSGEPKYMMEGRLTVSAAESDAVKRAAWKVEAVDIDTGRTPPSPSTTQRTPPPPQGGGPGR